MIPTPNGAFSHGFVAAVLQWLVQSHAGRILGGGEGRESMRRRRRARESKGVGRVICEGAFYYLSSIILLGSWCVWTCLPSLCVCVCVFFLFWVFFFFRFLLSFLFIHFFSPFFFLIHINVY